MPALIALLQRFRVITHENGFDLVLFAFSQHGI